MVCGGVHQQGNQMSAAGLTPCIFNGVEQQYQALEDALMPSKAGHSPHSAGSCLMGC